jgi:hypothetical protein
VKRVFCKDMPMGWQRWRMVEDKKRIVEDEGQKGED